MPEINDLRIKECKPTLVPFPFNDPINFVTKPFIEAKSGEETLPEPSKRNAMSASEGHSVGKKR